MQQFTELYLKLDRTTRTSEKLNALRDYFRTAAPIDAVWAIYIMTGRKIGRTVSWRQLRDWAAEVSGYPIWLVDECYHLVGDLSEALSLLIPTDSQDRALPPSLHEIVEDRLRPLGSIAPAAQREMIVRTWSQLSSEQRLVFHKLLSADFRVGVSGQLLVRALADVAGVDAQVMAHRLAGKFSPDIASMDRIMHGSEDGSALALPYPFRLAHPLHQPVESLGSIGDWLLEWKWDGIRAQIIRRDNNTAIWSRGDELISGAFPDLIESARGLPAGTVLDGEIVAWNENTHRPLPFAQLQRRLNRKHVELSFWPDVPIAYIAFDLLEIDSRDVRGEALESRRAKLDALLAAIEQRSIIRASACVDCGSWTDLERILAESLNRCVEGLMLKRLDSTYQAGRPTGLWWKLKIQPFTVDAVLIAAQSGHGRRAGLLTDYTFGVWDDARAELLPVAKAYSGLTDEEILKVDRWVRRHTVDRYGPVHAVEPVRVFELGFEAIQRSDRHKSGLAVRFPRILRIRQDKKAIDADTILVLRDLLKQSEQRH